MSQDLIQRLTGATIHDVKRDGIWLVLKTSQGEVHLTTRTTRGTDYCGHCGEEKLIEAVTDARGTEAYCTVCGKSWRVA